MEKIKIVTDSTADIPMEVLKQNDIDVLPLLINFGEESYLDGVDIHTKEMLEKVQELNMLPTTAQITPSRFCQCYEKYLQEGYKIIVLTLSSEMSGTYQSACIAKDMIESEDIVVIDSKNVTSGLGILVLKAAKLRDRGLSIKEIEKDIIDSIPNVKSVLGFESLDHLIKGGRLSKTVGIIGSVLGIRLILEVKDGQMAVKEKVRGSKKAIRSIIENFEKLGYKEDETVVLLHIENKDIYEPLKQYLENNKIEYIDAEVGCTVGVHSGPKACGLFFIQKN